MTKLVLDKVSKRFDATEVIHSVSLDINPGEFVVFVGPSGCGKSTLLRMIAGLETVTAGSVLIDDERMNNVPPAKRGIAMVFQSYALYPHMSVYENLAFGLQTLGASKSEIATKVAKAAKVLQIEPLLQRKPRQLSGGQRQRVAIGRAIVRTHDQVEAMTLADRIVVLRLGVVEQIGSPLELYNRPINKFVAGFIGSPKMNLLNIKVTATNSDAANFDLAGTELSLPVAIALGAPGITLGVRPEHVVTGNKGALSLGCVRVTHVEQLGGNAFVYGRLFDGQSMTLSLEGQQNINAEQEIPISIDPALCHIFNAEGLTVARQET